MSSFGSTVRFACCEAVEKDRGPQVANVVAIEGEVDIWPGRPK